MKFIFQKWLFLLVVLAFLITFAASWHLHSYLAELSAIDMLESTLSGVSRKISITEDNLKAVTHLSDAAALAKTHAFALLIASDPSILHNKEKLDAVIVGSDQVWRWDIMGYNYFLDFIRKGTIRKYAYAASFGLSHWESRELDANQIKLLLKEFEAISVREQTGVSICNQVFGVPAQLVVDPTLLYDADDYEAAFLRNRPKEPSNKVVTYILGEENLEQCQNISQWAEGLGMEHRELYWTRLGYPALKKGTNFFFHLSVEDWLDEIRNAAYVITNSYHCMVFAILFRKKFVVLNNVSGGSDRIRTLMSALQLKHRFFASSDDFYQLKKVLDTPVSYEDVEERIHACRREAISFLENIK